MNAKEFEIMRKITKQAVAECEDIELLDLVYKLMVQSKEKAE